MIRVPTVPDLGLAENAAFRLAHKLYPATSTWSELIASAQATIGYYQDIEQVEQLHSEQAALPLIAAARILDAASENSSELPPEEKAKLALLAATAFAMYGNFASSHAILSRLETRYALKDLPILAATIAPTRLKEILNYSHLPARTDYLQFLNQFLNSGSMRDFEVAQNSFIEHLLAAESSFEASLLRSAHIALRHLFILSTARELHNHAGFASDYIQHLLSTGRRVLLPPQRNALARGLLKNQGNALLSLPTSTGKTLLAELALTAALSESFNTTFYIAPYVALARQVASTIESHLPSSIRVVRLIGGYAPDASLTETQRQIVVATPERFDALLRNQPTIIQRTPAIVFDEAHLIENDTRGVRLEGVLTRLRMLQDQGKFGGRLILLSAVLTEYSHLARWLNVPSYNLFIDDWKPTARRLAIWRQNGSLTWHLSTDPIKPEGAPKSSSLGYTLLTWPNKRFYPAQHIGQQKQQEPWAYANVAHLVNFMLQSGRGPILCVCATKGRTREVAEAIAQTLPDLEKLQPKTESTILEIEKRHQYLMPLRFLLKRGVAYHNSTLPRVLREGIEDAAHARELQVVVSTTTLAEGVDLPFKSTVIVDWLLWRDSQFEPMPTLLFRNIAGRCGRAGAFTEGNTIVFDNPVGDASLTDPTKREAHYISNFIEGEVKELDSALDDSSGNAPSDINTPVNSTLAAQFLAAIPENPSIEDLPLQFAAHSYASAKSGDFNVLRRKLDTIRDMVLNEDNGALARAASPLKLTPLGTDANRSGFSPTSTRRLIQALQEISADLPLVDSATILLGTLHDLPEQPSDDLRKLFSKSKSSSKIDIRRDDVHPIISHWISGQSEERIFAALPKALKSTTTPSVSQWLNGNAPDTSWYARFDRFVDFLSSVLQSFLPWVFRACEALHMHSQKDLSNIPWRAWADMVEVGADSEWAVAILKNAPPVSRQLVVDVARGWPLPKEDAGLGLSLIRKDPHRLGVLQIYFQTLLQSASTNLPTQKDAIEALWAWLSSQESQPQM